MQNIRFQPVRLKRTKKTKTVVKLCGGPEFRNKSLVFLFCIIANNVLEQ